MYLVLPYFYRCLRKYINFFSLQLPFYYMNLHSQKRLKEIKYRQTVGTDNDPVQIDRRPVVILYVKNYNIL